MNTGNTQDGVEPSGASACSQLRERMAALVYDAMRMAALVYDAMRLDREAKTPKWQGGNSYAEDRARQAASQIAALSQPTLTDEEREVLARVADDACYRAMDHTEHVVRKLLERSTVAEGGK